MHRIYDTIHGIVYYAPEGPELYGALGVTGRSGYFASRGAALGAAPAPVVKAAFFGHHHAMVERIVPAIWQVVTPQQMIDARFEVADRAFHRTMPGELDTVDMREASALGRDAAGACLPEGRALCAGNLAIPFAGVPHVDLWHAMTIIREHRGDGHNAVNVAMGLDSGETLRLHAAQLGRGTSEGLKRSREWPDDEWQGAEDRLRIKGLVDDAGEITDAGHAFRARIEEMTDDVSVGPWDHIGHDAARRLRELIRPVARAIVDSGTFGGPPSDPEQRKLWGV
jgi:hypothetical protein